MSKQASTAGVRRSAVAGTALVVAAGWTALDADLASTR